MKLLIEIFLIFFNKKFYDKDLTFQTLMSTNSDKKLKD
jgi:hypothetical protein